MATVKRTKRPTRSVADLKPEKPYVTTKPASRQVNGVTVTIDDFIKVLPSPNRRDGFTGRVRAWGVKDDEVVWVDVWGGKRGYEKMRSILVNRLEVLSARQQKKLQATFGDDDGD